ncbi:MAG TPA: alpha/beta hydrolase [Chloroflexota bacterium]|nr:alpha/beta hydrolase [Chloroflexota bacterium]
MAAVVVLGVAGFVAWASAAAPPSAEALAALESGGEVAVQSTRPDGWLVFRPRGGAPVSGLVVYPGGRVDARAYAPLARDIAAGGFLVVIVPVRLNLAILDVQAAAPVQRAFPEIRVWSVGGHSLGGTVAGWYAREHASDGPLAVRGLVLWGAYLDAGHSLRERPLSVVSISGSLDGLSTPEKIEAGAGYLPPGTRWVVIEGGNHAQFGWYGAQAGDRKATISREEQQRAAAAATRELLASLARA